MLFLKKCKYFIRDVVHKLYFNNYYLIKFFYYFTFNILMQIFNNSNLPFFYGRKGQGHRVDIISSPLAALVLNLTLVMYCEQLQ